MTEDVSAQEKVAIVRTATSPGALTLLTKDFGRGTDFIIFDEIVATNYGVHVIQTFFSFDPSEEIQIRGRAARQGRLGSYSLVLVNTGAASLEQFKITLPEIDAMKSSGCYLPKMHGNRNALFKERWAGNQMNLSQILEVHNKTMKFYRSVSNCELGISKEMKDFLLEQNVSAYTFETSVSSRTVVLMDATGSMHSVIENTKNAVKTMFASVYQILAEEKPGAIFEVQFACYRNYSSGETEILQASPWSTKPEPLHAFINTVRSSGGQGNEAIEIGFWHVNNEIDLHPESPVSQIILIGDMPPNTRDDVTSKREGGTWVKYSTPTYYEDELKRLKERNVKINGFYVDTSAQQVFSSFSSTTGGESALLNVKNPDNAAKCLTDFVSTRILNDVGGAIDGSRLVAAYKRKYGYVL